MGQNHIVQNGTSHPLNPTLPSFSLAGRVCVITGGAQGLGLVMSRALVLSGASVAIVDLQSDTSSHIPQTPILTSFSEEKAAREAETLISDFKNEYPNATK